MYRLDEYKALEQALGIGYRQARRRLKFEKGTYLCYRCALPGDRCANYSQQRKYEQVDVVIGLGLASWGAAARRQRLECVAHIRSTSELLKFLGQRGQIGGVQASKAIEVAAIVIK